MTIRELTTMLVSSAFLGLWGCEAVANLDDVKMAEQGGAAGEAGSELDGGPVDAPGDGPNADVSDAIHAADAEDAADAPDEVVAPDAPDGEDAGPFPPACVMPGSVSIQCNPMTNEGCGVGAACDIAANGSQYGFVCFPQGEGLEGDACDGVSGPWCRGTLHCDVSSKCTKFCCTSADCGGSTPQCGMYDPFKIGSFGWCI